MAENIVEFREPQEEPKEVPLVTSVEDADYDKLTPVKLSADMVFAEEFDFKLTQASIRYGRPITARVRMVNLMDRALMPSMESNVRELVSKLFFTPDTNPSKKRPSPEQRTAETQRRIKETAYAYACAGFVEPRLRLEEKDVQAGEMWVGALPLHDLTEFVRICEGDDQLAARRLEVFSH